MKAPSRCGTRAGYIRHIKKDRTPPCAECREAHRIYMRKYREDSEHRQATRDGNNARTRALWRLADLHPAEFQQLVEDEKAAIQRIARSKESADD